MKPLVSGRPKVNLGFSVNATANFFANPVFMQKTLMFEGTSGGDSWPTAFLDTQGKFSLYPKTKRRSLSSGATSEILK